MFLTVGWTSLVHFYSGQNACWCEIHRKKKVSSKLLRLKWSYSVWKVLVWTLNGRIDIQIIEL